MIATPVSEIAQPLDADLTNYAADPRARWMQAIGSSIIGGSFDPKGCRYGNSSAVVAIAGRMDLYAVETVPGTTVTNVTFWTATAAATTPQNWWVALYDSSFALLSQSADQATAAVAANTRFTLALGAAQLIGTGRYFVGIMFNCAVAQPTLQCNISMSGLDVTGFPAVWSGYSTTGLTTTAPNPAAALTAVPAVPLILLT